jgi:hypothetical protein
LAFKPFLKPSVNHTANSEISKSVMPVFSYKWAFHNLALTRMQLVFIAIKSFKLIRSSSQNPILADVSKLIPSYLFQSRFLRIFWTALPQVLRSVKHEFDGFSGVFDGRFRPRLCRVSVRPQLLEIHISHGTRHWVDCSFSFEVLSGRIESSVISSILNLKQVGHQPWAE